MFSDLACGKKGCNTTHTIARVFRACKPREMFFSVNLHDLDDALKQGGGGIIW